MPRAVCRTQWVSKSCAGSAGLLRLGHPLPGRRPGSVAREMPSSVGQLTPPVVGATAKPLNLAPLRRLGPTGVSGKKTWLVHLAVRSNRACCREIRNPVSVNATAPFPWLKLTGIPLHQGGRPTMVS